MRNRGEPGRSASIAGAALAAWVAGAAEAPAALAPQAGPDSGRILGDLFRPPMGSPRRVTSARGDLNSNDDFIPLSSGAEITLAALKGPGVITRFWITLESDDPYYGRLIVLRAKWDGEKFPSIEVPIGDFFGVGHALEADVDTLPVHVGGDGRARVSYWPMPFNDSAEITIRNDSSRPARLLFFQFDWLKHDAAVAGLRTLHAHFRASARDGTLRQHKVAEIAGAGHYVGTVLSVWSGEDGWPGEGDDRFFIDGAQRPTLEGTGFEGYFDEAWGFRTGTGPFGGVTLFEGTGAGARTTAVRWHLADPIPFEKGLSLTFERAGWAKQNDAWRLSTGRKDAYSSVAFWYQAEPHGPLAILPPQNERLPFFEARIEPEEADVLESMVVPDEVTPPEVQRGSFWAYGAQVAFRPGKREEGVLSFPFDVPSPREYDLYVRLTRSPDAGAWRVWIDGEPVGAPMDLFAPRAILREQLLGRVHLVPGGHTFEMRCTGKNLESTGHSLGLDSFMIRWYP